ncbi:glutaredoxin family protein [Thalassotalea sp. PS06]|uniref:glutaredoxin family protein n=1 Tax=Thalassotalea sp. PS06 TaxID=2594005 RepID=UPI001162BE9F|nr:glutaredoxin family protein [Thalassotalea sp. PS06]QDP01384.1 glutaredoxin family protein [Thalassotalea sp. PS06]
MKTIYLYGTEGCHLCEMAMELCQQSPLIENDELVYRDIIDDPLWLERYKLTIPVIEVEGQQQVLGWPFDLQQLNEFINGNN